ncbi:MAG: hypothetical protein AAGH15_14475 [Myxococcota bacterium]
MRGSWVVWALALGCSDPIVVGPVADLGADEAGEVSADAGGGEDGGPDAGSGDAGRPDAAVDGGGMDLGDAATPRVCGLTIGLSCTSNGECDDRCFCTGPERCRGGFCIAGPSPCRVEFACTSRTCDEATAECGPLTTDDAACDDGNSCNGPETCDLALGCVDGTPLSCSDGDACTSDACDPDTGECLHVPRDRDADGCPDVRCVPASAPGCFDCDDSDPDVNSDATEDCSNFADDDCDGLADVFDPDCA